MKYVIDIDGTICTVEKNYQEAKSLSHRIQRVNELFDEGHHICLFTARGTESGIDWRPLTEQQLKVWGVKYDSLQFGKPSGDFYIDDKGLNVHDNW